MHLTKQHIAILVFNALYIIGFGGYFALRGDYEFLWYVAVLIFFFVLIGTTLHRSGFSSAILWGLSIWGLLHMAGGSVPVGDDVLYGLKLIDIWGTGDLSILKFDQFVHAYGFGVSTFVVHHLLKPYLQPAFRMSIVLAVVILAGMGLGVVNEIVEFIAVLSFPETGVGGYANTALDLVFNTFGALIAGMVIYVRQGNTTTSG